MIVIMKAIKYMDEVEYVNIIYRQGRYGDEMIVVMKAIKYMNK